MEEYTVESDEVRCNVTLDRETRFVTLRVRFHPSLGVNTFEYLAAAPIDRHASFSGSGLPFASPEMAFEGSPNKGTASVEGGAAVIQMPLPNSYYTFLGTVLIAPTVYITYHARNVEKKMAIKLDDQVPFRSLTYDSLRTGVTFYSQKLPVRSQEEILCDSAYPEKRPFNFWGLKPAM